MVAFLVARHLQPCPPPSLLSDFYPLHVSRNPFDPFPLSRSNVVAVLFSLPSHFPLSGSFALIHRSPRPFPRDRRPIIVTRRRRTGKRDRDGTRGETFLYLRQRVWEFQCHDALATAKELSFHEYYCLSDSAYPVGSCPRLGDIYSLNYAYSICIFSRFVASFSLKEIVR